MIELQFQRRSYEGHTTVGALVSIKNTTDNDIAAMTWSCDLFDHGQQVGRGDPVTFTIVPKNSIAVDTQYLYANGGMFDSARCELVRKEDRTTENESLYRAGPQRANVPIDDTRFWHNDRAAHGTAANWNVGPQ